MMFSHAVNAATDKVVPRSRHSGTRGTQAAFQSSGTHFSSTITKTSSRSSTGCVPHSGTPVFIGVPAFPPYGSKSYTLRSGHCPLIQGGGL